MLGEVGARWFFASYVYIDDAAVAYASWVYIDEAAVAYASWVYLMMLQ